MAAPMDKSCKDVKRLRKKLAKFKETLQKKENICFIDDPSNVNKRISL